MKAGDRVKVDFIGESATIYSGKRFTGYGVLDRVEDGRVFGRLDDGTPFMCLCADVEVIGMSDFEDVKPYTQAELDQQAIWANEFDQWWESEGQYQRAGGGQYERSFAWWAWLNQEQKQQAKIDELQKENTALVHVIKSRDIQLENEKHEYDELVNKLVDSKMKNTKLQKRVDAALEITKQGIRKQGGDYYLEKLEQALKGGDE